MERKSGESPLMTFCRESLIYPELRKLRRNDTSPQVRPGRQQSKRVAGCLKSFVAAISAERSRLIRARLSWGMP